MRKTKFFSVIIIFCAIFLLASCHDSTRGGRENIYNAEVIQSASGAEVAEYIMDKLYFQDTMSAIDMEIGASLFNLTENEIVLENSMVICSTGATAEEIAVFTVKEDGKDQVIEACLNRVEAQIQSFENYVPEELEKLENPVVISTGNKVILVVCNDTQNAEELINSYGL